MCRKKILIHLRIWSSVSSLGSLWLNISEERVLNVWLVFLPFL